MSTSIAGLEEMDLKSLLAGGRNVLCLFDVDGTLTPPREVRCEPVHLYKIIFFNQHDSYEIILSVTDDA